jgi:arylsulfatase A
MNFFKIGLSVVAGWIGVGVAVAAGAEAAAKRPNFVVILCDDLGWGDLSAYGHPQIRTPNLDRLAAAGMRFTSCYSPAPVCSPSRVGLMTGRSPNRAGIYDWIPEATSAASAQGARHLVHLRKEETTLPKLLQGAGYATALAGKWHGNSRFNDPAQPQPGDLGFDHWFATQNNAAPSHENPVNFVRNGQAAGPQTGFSCQVVAREAVGWLEKQQAAKPGQPFFLYVAFHEPHEPVASPAELVAEYRSKARNDDEAQYFANVANMDRAVGEVLAALERLKVAEDTVVFFSSDNGPETLNRYPAAKRSYGTPGPHRGMKLWTTEAGVRVPGILRWPRQVAAGQIRADAVSSLDLLPTFAALAGAQVPAGLKLDGTDLRPLLAGGPLARTQPLFWVYYNAINEQRVALRDGNWKLLAKLDGGKLPRAVNVSTANAARLKAAQLTDFSLYRMTDDAGETRDLAATEPEKLKELTAKLQTLYTELTATMRVWE